jgi:hypothetical protein
MYFAKKFAATVFDAFGIRVVYKVYDLLITDFNNLIYVFCKEICCNRDILGEIKCIDNYFE